MSEVFQSTTQQFLDIYDITNNYVVMKDGTVSVILTVDAMNFGLLAEEEQDAIMYAYAGLLNSLNYTVQIIIQSRTKDVTSYLKLLQEQEVITENPTMQQRIRMYREFVGNLIHERNVLDKKFYVVIPATALEMGLMTASSILPGKSNFDIKSIERSVILEKAQNLLDPKRDHLIAQFARIGLYSRQLATQEIIQLFYVRYNPEAAEGQQIGESNMYTTPLVRASVQESSMINAAPGTFPPQANPVTPEPMPVAAAPQPIMAEPVMAPVAAAVPEVPVQEVAAITPTGPATPMLPPLPELPSDAPIAPPVESPAPPVLPSEPPPLETTIPVTAPAPTVTPPSAPDELSLQNDLNAAIQELGVTPAPDAPASTSDSPSDLPPLPEI